MALPTPVSKHHTVWITAPDRRAVALRYAVLDDALVCFGDDGLADLPTGSRVTATVHEIRNGAPLASFGAVVTDLAPADIPLGVLSDVVGNRSLGANLEEVEHALLALRTTRRLVALRP